MAFNQLMRLYETVFTSSQTQRIFKRGFYVLINIFFKTFETESFKFDPTSVLGLQVILKIYKFSMGGQCVSTGHISY